MPSPRGLVLDSLLPSRPQERFRTWPRRIRLGDLEGIVFHKAGQISTKEVPLRGHAAITGMDPLGEPFFVLLATQTDLR